jgi:hypothetical protein
MQLPRKLTMLVLALTVGGSAAAISAPAMALPSYCTQQAWWFCDPYYTRGTAEWRACVDDFVSTCVYNGCIPAGGGQCIADRAPKAVPLEKLKKFQKKA